MRIPLEAIRIFSDRRQRLAELIPGCALIAAAAPEYIRNNSVHHPYRQDSSLYYLTGFEEPESVFVFRPGQNPESVLFVRKKNKERETWDGFRYGPEAAQETFKIDKVFPIEELESQVPQLLKGVEKLYYRLFKNPEMDKKIENILLSTRLSQGRTGFGLLPLVDADELIGEMRLIKTDAELTNHKKACEISAEAHLEVMHYIKPEMNERELHGYFIYQAMKRGAAREGYGGIVASGANATTLHYVFNDRPVKAGEMMLIDCGAEYNYFTGDITRSYPVNGKFTNAQAEIYEGVLRIQKEIIQTIKPGVPFQTFHEMGTSMLTDLMLELGLLSGRKDDIIKAQEHKKYYPHGIGHFLGMDVHDLGMYMHKNGEPRKIEENMVFTVEPGLYIPADDSNAPAEYRGIGVRIEDNIRVTRMGFENLTIKAPKELSELERIIRNSP